MAGTESGNYRVYPAPHDECVRLVSGDGGEPIDATVGDLDGPSRERVASVRPGNLVAAELNWTSEDGPSLVDVDVETRTEFAFVDGTADIFETARETFEQGRLAHEPVTSRVTYDTDGEANGALYTVAKQSGETDVFEGFRAGRLTLEPMIRKLAEGGGEPPFEVFVIRPATEPFVVLYLTLDRAGLLANTIRDEYDCPRP